MIFNNLKMLSGIFTAALIFTALLGATVSAQTTHTFSNTAAIDILDYGPATPYSNEITINNFPTSATSNFKVTIKNFTHDFPDDVGLLLVAPDGKKVRILTDCMGGTDANGAYNVNLTFDDSAPNPLPDNIQGNVQSGTYKTCQGTDDNGNSGASHPADFPAPAPSGPYSNTLATFNGINPTGTWKLFVDDDTAKDAGGIAGGWELSFQTWATSAPAVISGNVNISGVSVVNARITLTDSNGGQTIVYTDPFNNGYYEFPPMPSGQTYVLSVWAKSTTFTPSSQVVSLSSNTTVNWSGQ